LSTAQSFPVQVIAQATPPTPVNFSDFANASALNGPLRVQLVLNDFQISDRQVRLQVTYNGNGIGFQSNENVIGATPLFLEGGIPTVLDHTLLAPYFEFGNLTGIPPNVYGSPIPDGVYQVCFQVFDVLTGKRLSNNACTTINVFKNSPPILVLPENGSDIVERSPQNIMFQWTPRHINVSQVEYELSLVEIWDNVMDPQAAFLGSTPLFTTTTSATTYVYGPGDPMLLPNRTYAWRVQAKAKQGAEDIGMFLNQGYSQVFSFDHIEGCYVPNGIYHEVRGANQANIFWEDNSTSVPQFRVRYRAQGNGNAWFYNQTTANWTTLWDLQAGTTYEYQLKKTCAVGESDWSPLRQFTTNLETEEEDLYQCGVSPSVDIANQEPLPQLGVGESFTAGDFQVVATEVHGGNGYFSGKGYTRLPYLSNIKLAVHFTNILVNTDRQLAQGTVITEFDPTMGNIVDTGDVVQTVGELVEAIGEFGEAIDALQQLIQDKEDGSISEDEFEEGWNTQTKILEESAALLDADPKIPEAMQEEANRIVGNKFLASTNNEIPSTSGDLDTAKKDLDKLEEINEIIEKIKNSKKLIATIYEVDIATGGHDKKHTEEHYDHIFEHEDASKVNAATYIYRKKADYGDPYFEFEKVGRVREIFKNDLPSEYLEGNAYVSEFDFRGKRYNAINHKNYYQSGTAFMKVLAENPVDAAVWNMLRDMETEKQQRILGNVVQITGGVIAIVAAAPSGGGSISYFAMLEVSAGTAASVSGGLKLYYNAGANFAQADNIPNGLGGSLGKLIGYSMGYEEEGEQMGEFVEGVLFGFNAGEDLLGTWVRYKTTKKWDLNKKKTLDMLDNFIDIYQGLEGIGNLKSLKERIEVEE
jgi:tetratricopeptide (TPR) repeat protein